jgi:hypothetical protein
MLLGDPRECRKHASHCAELSASASTVQLKTAFADVANRWESIALLLERLQQMFGEDLATALAPSIPQTDDGAIGLNKVRCRASVGG